MTHVVSRFDRILHRSLAVLAAVLIPLALIVGLGRELLPYIGEQKPRIEQWLSAKAGLDIRIASLEGDWRQLSPVLTARNISLRDPAHPDRVLLTLPSISTTPDWWATLRDRSPRLRTTLSGLQLTVLATAQGEFRVQEFAGLRQSDPAKALQALRWLLAQPGLSLQGSQLRLRVPGEPDLKVRDLRLTQFNSYDDYRLQVGFRLAQSEIEQQALLVMNNDPLQWRKSPWQVYLQLHQLPAWQPWLRSLQVLWPLPAGWNVQLREGNLKLWLGSDAGAPTMATAVLGQVGAAVNVPGHEEQIATALSGVVSVRHQADAVASFCRGLPPDADDLRRCPHVTAAVASACAAIAADSGGLVRAYCGGECAGRIAARTFAAAARSDRLAASGCRGGVQGIQHEAGGPSTGR